MITMPNDLGSGAGNLPDLYLILKEIQGLTVSVLTGAAANTAIPLAAIRKEDTILSAINFASGVPSDVTGTATISETRATGTLTVTSVVDGNSCVVNGFTYTFKTTPTALNHIAIAGTDALNAQALAAAITKYEARYNGTSYEVPKVTTSVSSNVVTVKAIADGTAGNAITLTGTASKVAASGSGTLAGGTATGSLKFSGITNNLIVAWYNKK
jgi:hypothetical protein